MLKKIVLIVLIFQFPNCFAQLDKSKTSETESFQSIYKPSPNSALSQFLIKHIGVHSLNKVKFDTKHKSKEKIITLTFQVNKDIKPYKILVYTGDFELNKKIAEAFKKYPIKKLGLNSTNQLGTCKVQLFSKEKNKTIINASTVAVYFTPPIFKNCLDVNNISQLNSCFYKELKNHILQNFSLGIFNEKQRKKMKNIKFVLSFSIDKEGRIYNIFEDEFKFESYANNPMNYRNPKKINEELRRVLKLLGNVAKPAMRNGNPTTYNYDTFYTFKLK